MEWGDLQSIPGYMKPVVIVALCATILVCVLVLRALGRRG